jgi:hypothetical protein
VVPPKLDLPPPASSAADVKAPNWPKDPDEAVFSMLVPPMPFMMPSMIFSSTVLSSSSSSARATPEASSRPTPRAMAENRSARVSGREELRSMEPQASVLRIALPVKNKNKGV